MKIELIRNNGEIYVVLGKLLVSMIPFLVVYKNRIRLSEFSLSIMSNCMYFLMEYQYSIGI